MSENEVQPTTEVSAATHAASATAAATASAAHPQESEHLEPAAKAAPAKEPHAKDAEKQAAKAAEPKKAEKDDKADKELKKEKPPNILVNIQVDEKALKKEAEAYYPYKKKLPTAEYEVMKFDLQIELLKWQNWIKESGERVMVFFEGRDAAGKGGTIKRVMEHLNPRGARVVALEKPSERERT